MQTETITPARPKGRERTCAHCQTIYRSKTKRSKFCSSACRIASFRGDDPRRGAILRKRLEALGFIGPVGPWNKKNPRPTTYALLVPVTDALAEINARYNRPSVIRRDTASMSLKDALGAAPEKVAPDMKEKEFRTLLRKQGIALP